MLIHPGLVAGLDFQIIIVINITPTQPASMRETVLTLCFVPVRIFPSLNKSELIMVPDIGVHQVEFASVGLTSVYLIDGDVPSINFSTEQMEIACITQ